MEREGFQFEDAEGSFALLVHRCSPSYRQPFEPLAYHIDIDKAASDDGSRSRAVAEVAVGGKVLRGEAAGGGPVDALEKALRRALIPAYPHLDRVDLVDFRAYIARVREGPRGNVTVRITASVPGSPPWTTVGSASDLLHGAPDRAHRQSGARGADARSSRQPRHNIAICLKLERPAGPFAVRGWQSWAALPVEKSRDSLAGSASASAAGADVSDTPSDLPHTLCQISDAWRGAVGSRADRTGGTIANRI